MSDEEIQSLEAEEASAINMDPDQEMNTIDLNSFNFALAWNGKDLMGGYSLLNKASRFFLKAKVRKELEPDFLKYREMLFTNKTKYASIVKLVEMQRKKFSFTKKQLETKIIEFVRDGDMSIRDAVEVYVSDCRYLISKGIRPDPLVELAYLAFAKMSYRCLVSAYECYLICMRHYISYTGWRHYHIMGQAFIRQHFVDLLYENVRSTGNSNVSSDMKTMLQFLFWGCYSNFSLDLELAKMPDGEPITLRKIFELGAYLEALGYILEFPRPDASIEWSRNHDRFGEMISQVINILKNAFLTDAYQVQRLKLIPQEMYSYLAVFQRVPGWYRNGGELSGEIRLEPVYNFPYTPSANRNGILYSSGSTGCLSPNQEILTIEGPKKISNVSRSLWVLSQTSQGPRFVRASCLKTGTQKTFRVTTDAGVAVTTREHKFYTRDGWKSLKDLKVGDKVIGSPIWKQKSSCFHQGQELRVLWERIQLRVQKQSNPKILFEKVCGPLSPTSSRNRDLSCLSRIVRNSARDPSEILLAGAFENWFDSRESSSHYCTEQEGSISRESEEIVGNSPEKLVITHTGTETGLGGCSSKFRSHAINRMAKTQPRQTFRNAERILSKTSGASSQQFSEKESNDVSGKGSRKGSESFGNRLCLEQISESRREFCFSGLSNQGLEFPDRMQRLILASRLREGPKKDCGDRESWLYRSCFRGIGDKERLEQYLEYSTVLGIEEFTEESTYDLHVPVWNNYYLASGHLVHNSGKTTIIAGIAFQSVVGRPPTAGLGKIDQGIVLVALADNLNSYELACLPMMDLGSKNRGAWEYLTKTMRMTPMGIPVLMLNIITSLSELEDVPLTKYDRILMVEDYRYFKFDFAQVINALGEISKEFGYSKPCGIIAVRNLRRRGRDEQNIKKTNADIYIASEILENFGDWRIRNMDVPARIQFDEGGRAGSNLVKSSEQNELKEIVEQLSEDSRRWNTGLDFVTNLIVEQNAVVRNLAMNVFFARIGIAKLESKSPTDVLLGSLDITDEMREVVKNVMSKGHLQTGTHLMFWHNRDMQNCELIQSMPPPFQDRITDMTNEEIQKHYVKLNPDGRASNFFKEASDVPQIPLKAVRKTQESAQQFSSFFRSSVK